MGVNVEVVSGKEQKGEKYPVLKTTKEGLIVLFYEAGEGAILKPGTLYNYPVGKYGENWAEEDFSCFTGKVIFSNE